MKKSTLIGILVALGVVVLWAISCYNGFVGSEETANNAWADVEAAYQRRSDLIPNLVSTVKGYATHEKSTLEEVVSARSKATSVNLSVDELTEENMKKFQKAQGELSSALGRLLAITENYPDLKASENFSELQAQLEGTENRINEARKKFNAAVKEYNVSIRQFPGNVVANVCGFTKKTEFAAAEGAENAPTVSFE